MFSRENRRPKRAKMKFCFTFGAFVVLLSSSFVVAVVVPTWAGGAGSLGHQDLRRLALVLWSCVPSFCPLSRFVFGALPLKYAFIRVLRGFLAGFPCWMYVCVARVLCVACGAFVCVNS